MSNPPEVTALDLQKPFMETDIKWRVQQAGIAQSTKPYVLAIPYVSNRAIQKRLDELFGLFGWENAYEPTADGKGFLCGITLHGENRSITKWDGAEYTNIEALKGALSGAMKRTAVQLGIGRYLYSLEPQFARCEVVKFRGDADNCHKDKKTQQLIGWENPKLPAWALPFEDFDHLIQPITEASDMSALRHAFESAFKAAETSGNKALKTAATEAKNKRKKFIQENIDAINQGKHDTINEWLESQLSMFDELPSKSTVDNYCRLTAEGLNTRAKEQGIECPDLVEKLNQSYTVRINKLTKQVA